MRGAQREKEIETHLVLVHNPTLKLIIPALMGLLVLDDLVDAQMSQARALSQHLAMRRLADTRSAGDDDVRLRAGHDFLSLRASASTLYSSSRGSEQVRVYARELHSGNGNEKICPTVTFPPS